MKTVFYGDKSTARHGSGLTGVYYNSSGGGGGGAGGHGQLGTPPDDDFDLLGDSQMVDMSRGRGRAAPASEVAAWLEIWDYAGGASFRGFLADNAGEKSLFAFFDAGIVGHDLKQA